jgi:hypothetical protein
LALPGKPRVFLPNSVSEGELKALPPGVLAELGVLASALDSDSRIVITSITKDLLNDRRVDSTTHLNNRAVDLIIVSPNLSNILDGSGQLRSPRLWDSDALIQTLKALHRFGYEAAVGLETHHIHIEDAGRPPGLYLYKNYDPGIDNDRVPTRIRSQDPGPTLVHS